LRTYANSVFPTVSDVTNQQLQLMSLRTFCGIRVCLVRIGHYHTYVVSYASGKRDVASVDGDSVVYAWNFSSLSLVKNVVLSKACRIIDFPTTTMTSLTPTAVTPSGIGYAKRCYDRNDSAISINCQNLA